MFHCIKIVKLLESESLRCLHVLRIPGTKQQNNRFGTTKHNAKHDKLKLSYVNCKSSKPFPGVTIGALLDARAADSGDIEAVVDVEQGIRKTYGDLSIDVHTVATSLYSFNLKRGDRIGIWSPNNYQWIVTFLAAAKLGLILVTINPANQSREIKYVINKVGIKAIVCAHKFKTQDYYQILRNALDVPNFNELKENRSKEAPSLEKVVIIYQSDEKYNDVQDFAELLDGSIKSNYDVQSVQKYIKEEDPCNIQFTSGTTGLPKAATLSHRNIVSNSYFVGNRVGYRMGKERLCIAVPLFHVYGCVGGLLCAIHYASTIVLPSPGFDAELGIKAAEKEKCTVLYGTPTMHVDHSNVPNVSSYDLSNIWLVLNGGAIIPVELMKEVMNKIKPKEIKNVYGMTETSPATLMCLPGASLEKIYNTIGYPMDHIEARIVDEKGNIAPVNVMGELQTRGYVNMLGYWNDEEKTKETISEDGWLSTGDLFQMDEDGYCQIVGRSKDMVIRGGENIYPREIEDYLFEHPKIIEAVVVGVPDKRMGEELCAWIRLKEGEKSTEEDIREFCTGKLSHHKIPRYIVFTDTYPKTLSGKIQKFKVTEESIKLLKLEI